MEQTPHKKGLGNRSKCESTPFKLIGLFLIISDPILNKKLKNDMHSMLFDFEVDKKL